MSGDLFWYWECRNYEFCHYWGSWDRNLHYISRLWISLQPWRQLSLHHQGLKVLLMHVWHIWSFRLYRYRTVSRVPLSKPTSRVTSGYIVTVTELASSGSRSNTKLTSRWEDQGSVAMELRHTHSLQNPMKWSSALMPVIRCSPTHTLHPSMLMKNLINHLVSRYALR